MPCCCLAEKAVAGSFTAGRGCWSHLEAAAAGATDAHNIQGMNGKNRLLRCALRASPCNSKGLVYIAAHSLCIINAVRRHAIPLNRAVDNCPLIYLSVPAESLVPAAGLSPVKPDVTHSVDQSMA